MKLSPASRHECAIRPLPDFDLGPLVAQTWRSWIRRLAIRHLRRELGAWPDWLLYDIGVQRSEIESLVVEMVDGRAPRPGSQLA